MKRNRFGINLDEGLPLETQAEFDLLHVDCFAKETSRIFDWIHEGNKPLIFGGQIGSGKSTLINKAIQDSAKKPDIVLRFDRETLNLDAGDFWGITLAGFIKIALMQQLDLSFPNCPKNSAGTSLEIGMLYLTACFHMNYPWSLIIKKSLFVKK